MQKHLHFVEIGAETHGVAPFGQQRIDVAAYRRRERRRRQGRRARKADIPVMRANRSGAEFPTEVRGDRGRECIGLVLREPDFVAREQNDAIPHDAKVHRVRAQPVAVSRCLALGLECERRERPVLLAGDSERLADGAPDSLGRLSPTRAARQQRLQGGEAKIGGGDVEQALRGEQMRNEKQHGCECSKAKMAPMRQIIDTIPVPTRGKGLYACTDDIRARVRASAIERGLLTLYIRHTSASLLIQENYDPTVQSDLERFLSRLVPEGDPIYEHVLEGADDMPAHVRAALTQTHLAVPVIDGAPMLGTWQGIYVFEHRRAPQTRSVVLHLLGE